MVEKVFKHIVRIAGIDISGELTLPYGLSVIKGIGYNTALAIVRKLGLDPRIRVGFLSDDDVKMIEDAVSNLGKYGVPAWYMNRRKDYAAGKDLHLIGADLIFAARQDIEREMKMKSWRGIRHSLGLKVRGQRTHTTGRIGPTVGVSRRR
ncbi:MAG: 30S ribosomal protein S13 [Desulfurococcales archaeon ex4484_204]|nr:MAG: 30S ribosomal protein S13 [Desulfurococcales archaeon ex4484_204]